jgi:hypothetical protein
MEFVYTLRPYLKDNTSNNPDRRFGSCLDIWFVFLPKFKQAFRAQLFLPVVETFSWA